MLGIWTLFQRWLTSTNGYVGKIESWWAWKDPKWNDSKPLTQSLIHWFKVRLQLSVNSYKSLNKGLKKSVLMYCLPTTVFLKKNPYHIQPLRFVICLQNISSNRLRINYVRRNCSPIIPIHGRREIYECPLWLRYNSLFVLFCHRDN